MVTTTYTTGISLTTGTASLAGLEEHTQGLQTDRAAPPLCQRKAAGPHLLD